MEKVHLTHLTPGTAANYLARIAMLAEFSSVEALLITQDYTVATFLSDDPARELNGPKDISEAGHPPMLQAYRTITPAELDGSHPHIPAELLTEFSAFVGKLSLPLHSVHARAPYSLDRPDNGPFFSVTARCDTSDQRQMFYYRNTLEALTGKRVDTTFKGSFRLSDDTLVAIKPAPEPQRRHS